MRKSAKYVVALLLLALTVLLFPSQSVKLPRGANASSPLSPTPPAQKTGDLAASRDGEAEAVLSALLRSQAEAWNRGDIEGFMAGYWKSDKTTFASSSGVFRGWQALLDRYRRNYPDRAAMGRLEFSDLEITLLAPDAALIMGHWQLKRQNDQPRGIFTLIARRFPEGWRITHDHTSINVPPAPANLLE